MFQVLLMQQPQVQPWLQNFLKPSRSRQELPAAGAREAASLLGSVQCVEGGEGQEKLKGKVKNTL